MLLASSWMNPAALVPLLIAIITAFGVVSAWWLTRDRDKAVKEAGEASGQSIWAGLVLTDNSALRAEVLRQAEELQRCNARIDAIETGTVALKDENHELKLEGEAKDRKIVALEDEVKRLKARITELERSNGLKT